MAGKKECKDHLGNIYSSITDMCRFYKLKPITYTQRIKSGWSVEEALTKSTDRYSCKDHLGNIFSSEKEMCQFYKIKHATYKRRIKSGWSIERALTESIDRYSCKDHLGNIFSSENEMCKFYNMDYKTYFARTHDMGWSVEQALTKPCRDDSVYDFNGRKFKNIIEMCKFYKISPICYKKRISNGWSVKDALTLASGERNYNIYHKGSSKQSIDHLDNIYNSFTDMCRHYNISVCTVQRRLYNGWTLEEALTIPKNMHIGEYRVAECLKQLNVKFYHDCSIKTIFKDLAFNINWNEFLDVLHQNLSNAGINWSKSKIEKLRPDFVLYTDNDDKICGIIEFDGEQHQNFVEFFFKTIEDFYRRSNYDFVKKSLWEYLNIPMLRIRHDQVDMIDDMIRDFINNPQNYIYNHNTYLSENEYWSILSEEKAKLELAFAS